MGFKPCEPAFVCWAALTPFSFVPIVVVAGGVGGDADCSTLVSGRAATVRGDFKPCEPAFVCWAALTPFSFVPIVVVAGGVGGDADCSTLVSGRAAAVSSGFRCSPGGTTFALGGATLVVFDGAERLNLGWPTSGMGSSVSAPVERKMFVSGRLSEKR
jgi:hypothetical protein